MPITDVGLLEAGREGIEVLLEVTGQTIVLVPTPNADGKTVRGTRTHAPGVPRAAQLFSLKDSGTFDGRERSNNDEGLSRKRDYTLTGRHNAIVAIGDTWEDSTASYTVGTVDRSSGFKIVCRVTAYLKEVGNGPF